MIASMPVQQSIINHQEHDPRSVIPSMIPNVQNSQSIIPQPFQIMCMQQLDPSYTPTIMTDPSSPKGKFSVEKDLLGRIVIKQPSGKNGWMLTLGIALLFCLPCAGALILFAVYKTIVLELILNDSNKELIIRTFGIYTKKEEIVTIPYANIASLSVVMNQSMVPDGLPNGKFFIITKDQNSMQVRKDAINYYSMVNMAQKATDLMNERIGSL